MVKVAFLLSYYFLQAVQENFCTFREYLIFLPSNIKMRNKSGGKRFETKIAVAVCANYFIKAKGIADAFFNEQRHIIEQVTRCDYVEFFRVFSEPFAYHIFAVRLTGKNKRLIP